MKRWESFNKYHEGVPPESMETQALKVFVYRMLDNVGVDVDEAPIMDDITEFFTKVDSEKLFNSICEWLNEEVEVQNENNGNSMCMLRP